MTTTMETSSETRTFVHPTALCETSQLGAGTRVWAYAHVMDGAIIGRACNICDRVFIEGGANIGNRVTIKNNVLIWDGVTIEDDVFVGPAVVFTNDRHPRSARMSVVASRYARKENWLKSTHIGQGASIGAGTIMLCGLSIGAYASIAAGSVVTKNVPAHRLIIGHPGKPAGWVCECGISLDGKLVCPDCELRYQAVGDSIKRQ